MKKFVIALILPVMAVLAGCASQIGANQYDSAAVGSVNRARAGTIVSVRAITVADSDNSLGTAIGGIAGGVAGSQIGKGSTAGVLGAVGGALVGGAAGQSGTTRPFQTKAGRIRRPARQRRTGHRYSGQRRADGRRPALHGALRQRLRPGAHHSLQRLLNYGRALRQSRPRYAVLRRRGGAPDERRQFGFAGICSFRPHHVGQTFRPFLPDFRPAGRPAPKI